ncbi:bifunctional diguanylate cyclase/phosphodiesterase [Undibacterium sp. Ren11W]|uniref:bifunctional diguanylate cyclase/phosphodiesterase n=1 Tax=Undibacterium sp. Ren11W TaxID=3413045 RepID=UPI003BEF9250
MDPGIETNRNKATMVEITEQLSDKRSLPSIRTKLTLVMLACLIPSVIGFSLLIHHFYNRERAQIKQDTIITARALVLAVDRDLNSAKMTTQALATARTIATHDFAAFYTRAKSVLNDEFPGFSFVLSDTTGQQLLNTLRPYGQVLPRHGNPDQLRQVFETGKPVISDVYIGGVLGRPLISIDVPVWLDDKVVYDLSVGILPERLGKILTEQRLPADRIVSIFDSKGVIVARSHSPEKFIGKKGAAALIDRLREVNEGEIEVTSLEGIRVYSDFSRSPSSGWAVAIGVPRSTVLTELLQSIVWITALVAALLASGFIFAWKFGTTISRSVHALASSDGEEMRMYPMSFREADEVAVELLRNQRSLEKLIDERTAECDLLEQRVIERTSELRETLNFNETILLHSPLPMGVYAASGQCVVANDAYGKLVGTTREVLLKQNFHDIVAMQKSGLLDDCLTALAQQVPKEREVHTVTSFGRNIWIACQIVPMKIKGEQHLLMQFYDLTERKLTEEKVRTASTLLEERERFIRAVTDNLPGLIAYWDTELHCRFANQAYLEWYGKTTEEMLGIRIQDFLGAKLYELNAPYLRRALGGERQNFERTLTKLSGEIAQVWANYIPDVDANGNVKGLFVLVTDITVLKQAEQERRIAATAFDSREAMMITDANMRFLRVNRAFTETTGYTPEDIVGQTPRILKSGRHDQAFYAAMWDSINGSGSWQGEIWDRRKNGEIFPSWLTITAVKNDLGNISHFVGTQTDITERKAAEEAISHLAFFDSLTGLPNRRMLMDRLHQSQATSARTGREGALMFIDMDNFKTLNDTLGHDKGDLLLQAVAKRLLECVRECDTVARLGGDEFVVMLEELSDNTELAAKQAESVGEKILKALNQVYDLAGHPYHSTPSIGVTLFADHKDSNDALLKRADFAMYQAKSAGRNTLRFFDPKIQDIITSHATLEAEFRLGLQRKEFVLYYQAQVDQKGRVTGVEALVRWQHPQRGMLSPMKFIPLAEETGLILNLGQWVLETACAQMADWAAHPEAADLSISVNVSAMQFRRPDYVELVLAALDKSGADPHKLKLEITESLLLHDVEDTILKMTALQAHGVSFALDDFGTGYSSLTYLKRLPLDQLKIDQSFVRDVLTDQNDATLARTIIALGQSLGLAVIAEGVETEDQRQFLFNHHCHAYQGFLCSPPLALAEFEQFIKRNLVST